MLQEFFKSTIYSKAIKYILSQTPLPMYKTITSNDYIYKGNTYVYRNHIIECVESGIFIGVNAIKYVDTRLYVSNNITVTDSDFYITRFTPRVIYDDEGNEVITYEYPLQVTNDLIRMYYSPVAKIKLVDDFIFGKYIPGVTQKFVSNTDYYDSETHRYLGEYLRCLRDIKGIDLMSLYNCFDYKFVDNIKFTATGVKPVTSNGNRVTLIPIKFNKQYSIAIDCGYPLRATAVLYKNRIITDEINTTIKNYLKVDNIEDILFKDKLHIFNNISFTNPVSYKLDNETEYLSQYEKYLYLAIEIPNNNKSSIVVLEGDYLNVPETSIADIKEINNLPDYALSLIFRTKPELLYFNDKKQRPFSDKLLEYLLMNTIDSRDTTTNNISKIEDKIKYNPKYKGTWSNTLRYILYNRYMDVANSKNLNKFDILGFVDKNMENAIEKDLIKYD